MKKVCLFILLSFPILTLHAQTKNELAVQTAVNKLIAGMISGDRSALESVSSSQLSYGHSGGLVEGRAEFVEKIASGKIEVAYYIMFAVCALSYLLAWFIMHLLVPKVNVIED
jgi:hypothetical protein